MYFAQFKRSLTSSKLCNVHTFYVTYNLRLFFGTCVNLIKSNCTFSLLSSFSNIINKNIRNKYHCINVRSFVTHKGHTKNYRQTILIVQYFFFLSLFFLSHSPPLSLPPLCPSFDTRTLIYWPSDLCSILAILSTSALVSIGLTLVQLLLANFFLHTNCSCSIFSKEFFLRSPWNTIRTVVHLPFSVFCDAFKATKPSVRKFD